MTTARRTYDHRLRVAIAEAGDPLLFGETNIPSSTRRSWVTRPVPNVVALHPEDRELVQLQVALAQARQANAKLRAVLRLLLALVATLGGRLTEARVPSARHKARLLAALRRSGKVLGRHAALRVLGLTAARVRDWERRAVVCTLADATSCPKHTPQQLTLAERRTLRDFVQDVALRHLSIASLALLAARRHLVVASAATGWREIRRQRLSRPRTRLYPARPKVGIRAARPNELWHIDATRIRLMDGTAKWIHGVIDNHSRKLLAWTVGDSCRAAATEILLREAVPLIAPGTEPVTVLTDGGSENVPVEADEFGALLRRVRAQVDVLYSNSMIESFWSQLKHRWLFLHPLDTEATLVRLVAEFVQDHNALIPRAALGGRTPDEVFLGEGLDVPETLTAATASARAERVAANRALASCGGCGGVRGHHVESLVDSSSVR
ncbi:MAG: transposase [Sandaracinaceae bacterium]|nr:transposase [Sandaracinaceae bacterium]